jgi:hypothetical protein
LNVTEKWLVPSIKRVRGRPVKLGGTALDILLLLVMRAGEEVSKNALIEWAWPNVVVDERNLKVHSGQEYLGELVVACRDGSKMLKFIDEALDEVPFAVGAPWTAAKMARARRRISSGLGAQGASDVGGKSTIAATPNFSGQFALCMEM